MLVAETWIEHVAHALGIPSHEVRERNLYSSPQDKTHYGMEVGDIDLPRIMRECKEMSDFETRSQVNREYQDRKALLFFDFVFIFLVGSGRVQQKQQVDEEGSRYDSFQVRVGFHLPCFEPGELFDCVLLFFTPLLLPHSLLIPQHCHSFPYF